MSQLCDKCDVVIDTYPCACRPNGIQTGARLTKTTVPTYTLSGLTEDQLSVIESGLCRMNDLSTYKPDQLIAAELLLQLYKGHRE
jgi:hypothetical protein